MFKTCRCLLEVKLSTTKRTIISKLCGCSDKHQRFKSIFKIRHVDWHPVSVVWRLAICVFLAHSSMAEAALCANTLNKFLHYFKFNLDDGNDHHLRDSIARSNRKGGVTSIPQ